MLKISRMANYATVIMAYLASKNKCVNTREIAQNTKISPPTVSKSLKLLAKNGLLESTLGTFGGYKLVDSKNEKTLFDIIQAVDGNFGLTKCSYQQGLCAREEYCITKHNWQIINLVIAKALKAITISDLNNYNIEKILVSKIFKGSTS